MDSRVTDSTKQFNSLYTASAENDELFCALPLKHAEAINFKTLAIKRHLNRLKKGEEIAYDKYHIEKYKNKLKNLPHKEGYRFNTATAYWALGMFTSIRLFIVRGLSILKSVLQPLKNNKPLSATFGILSLSYLIEVLLDFGVLAKHLFAPSPKQKKIPWHKRLKNAFFKNGRPARMANAIVWFPINLACFILTGGLSYVIITIAGLIFDSLLEITRYQLEENKRQALNQEIKASQEKQENLEHLQEIHQSLSAHILQKKQEASRKIYIAIGILTVYCMSVFPPVALVLMGSGILLSGLVTPIHPELNKRKTLLIALGIIAMTLAFAFPPIAAAVASIATILTVTATLTFAIGSLFGGLGRKCFEKLSEEPKPKEEEKKNDEATTCMTRTLSSQAILKTLHIKQVEYTVTPKASCEPAKTDKLCSPHTPELAADITHLISASPISLSS